MRQTVPPFPVIASGPGEGGGPHASLTRGPIPTFATRCGRHFCECWNRSTPLSPAPAKGGARRARAFLALALLTALAGAVLLGQGLWIHAKALLAQVLLERAFTQSVADGGPVKPWSWADTWPVARVEIPRLRTSAIVLRGGSGQALAFGPAQIENTPQPGEPGTTVFAAHRDTHFSRLGEARPGDAIDVTRADGRRFRFRITGTAVVRFDESGIDALESGRRLVLATCWPLDGKTAGPLRFLVYADLEA